MADYCFVFSSLLVFDCGSLAGDLGYHLLHLFAYLFSYLGTSLNILGHVNLYRDRLANLLGNLGACVDISRVSLCGSLPVVAVVAVVAITRGAHLNLLALPFLKPGDLLPNLDSLRCACLLRYQLAGAHGDSFELFEAGWRVVVAVVAIAGLRHRHGTGNGTKQNNNLRMV